MLLLVCMISGLNNLDNQLVCSSLRKSSPSFPQFPIVLCVGLKPCRIFFCPLWHIYWTQSKEGYGRCLEGEKGIEKYYIVLYYN